MTDRERVELLSRTFDLFDELLLSCVKDSEEDTRRAIRDEVIKRGDATDDEFEKRALMDAYKRLEVLSYEEMVDLRDTIGIDPEKEEEYQEGLREREEVLDSDPGNHIVWFDERINKRYAYLVKLKFEYEGIHYFLMVDLNLYDEDSDKEEVYEYVFDDDPYFDSFEKVTDEERLDKINKVIKDIRGGNNNG